MDSKHIKYLTLFLENKTVIHLPTEVYIKLLTHAIDKQDQHLFNLLQECSITDQSYASPPYISATLLVNLSIKITTAQLKFKRILGKFMCSTMGYAISKLITKHKWSTNFKYYKYWPRALYDLCGENDDFCELCLQIHYYLKDQQLANHIFHDRTLIKKLISKHKIHQLRDHYLEIYNIHQERTPTKILEELYKPRTGELWQQQVSEFKQLATTHTQFTE